MLKRIVAFLLSFALILSIVGVSLKASSSTTSKKEVVLRLLGPTGHPEEPTKKWVNELKKEGIRVEAEFYDWNTYDGKQKLAMTANGGDYDMIFLPGNYVTVWAKAKAIIPMDDFLKKYKYDLNDIYTSVKKFAIVDGHWYIVPYLAEAMVYFYRKDIFAKEGVKPPKTIDEMYQIAKKLTKNGMYGIAYPGGPGEGACSFWSYFLWSYGGTYFNEKWVPQLNTPQAINAAKMFAKILKECAPPGVSTWQNEETVAAFCSGKVASMIQWPGFWPQISDKTKSKVWDKVAVAPVPAGPIGKAVPRFGSWGLAITTNGKAKKSYAEKFIKKFTDENGLKEIAKVTSTASKKINSMSYFRKINPPLGPSADTLEYAQERPPIPEAQQYIEIVGNGINAIVAGADAKKTLDDVQRKVTEIMRKGGYIK
jgi:ABC-type glycerol-3-phosphate transport system substrate-binding protein